MSPNSVALQATTPPDACYRAMLGRDARFDGCFFVGVTTTGIYCRPVCRVKTPKQSNCRFFGYAAQAERAGFRPCLRCRPELAPHSRNWTTQDASAMLASQAAELLDEPLGLGASPPCVATLAMRLGVSERHLRRIFETQLGVSPLQYLQTRRLLWAKQLLVDTNMPITDVALSSGFASVRRFNAAFVTNYGINPTALRRGSSQDAPRASDEPGILVRLGYRPPYDVAAMLGFMAKRALQSVELVNLDSGVLARSFAIDLGSTQHTGWVSARFDEARSQLHLRVAPSLRAVLPVLIHRVRAWLDLDANPKIINALLQADFPQSAGLRVPGCLDGLELAVRAVLGQQITVAAARTLAQRLLDTLGTPIQTPWPELNRLFPSAAVLARSTPDALGQLGIVKQRQAAILGLAQAVDAGRLTLHGSTDVHATITALQSLPGVGDWTAQYIAMRALRWPDAFPAGDVVLHKALGVQGSSPAQAARAALQASQRWAPWRAYAVVRAWATLGP